MKSQGKKTTFTLGLSDPRIDPKIYRECDDSGFYCAGRDAEFDADALVACSTGQLVERCENVERQEFFWGPYDKLYEKPYLSLYHNYRGASMATRPSKMPVSVFAGAGCYLWIDDDWHDHRTYELAHP